MNMSRWMTMGLVVACCTLGARDVTLTAFNRATGEGTVTISAAEAGDGAKTLLAVWGPCDMGNVATNGRETAVLATVAAGETEKSFTVPARLRTNGVVRLFLMNGSAPYATRYEWIRTASAGPWIETGIVPTKTTDLSVTEYHPLDMAPFGVSGKFYLFCNSAAQTHVEGSYFYGFLGIVASCTAPRGTDFHTTRLNASGVYIDGVRKVPLDASQQTQTTTSTITLFARKADGTTSSVAKQGDCTMKEAWISTNGVLACDYMPCRTTNGTVTMWDRVAGAACEVKGTGTFEAGPELGPHPADCGTVESVTEPIRFGRTITVASRDLASGTVTLNLGEDVGDGRLYALAAAADAGTNTVSDWTAVYEVGPVTNAETTVTTTLPASWWTAGYAVRFVWVANDGRAYDRALATLSTVGSAYANTGWIPSSDTEIEIRAKSNPDVCAFGLEVYFYLFSNGGATFWGFFGQSGSFANYDPAGAYHTLKLGPSGAFLDGVLKGTINNPTNVVLSKATSICCRRNSKTGALSKQGVCSVAWAKIRERGVLVQDLIPVERDGVVGFYDRVWGTFYPPVDGSGSFEAGAEAPGLEDTAVLAWSDPGLLAAEANGTWDGGGSGDSFATAENWVRDTLPDLTNGTATLTFATNGATSATVAGPTVVRALVFNAKNDFTVRSASDTAVLSVSAGGITVADDPSETLTTWRYAPKFEGRVEVAEDQTWDLSTNSQRRIQFVGGAVLSGASNRTVTVTGSGVLGLVATNTYKGSFDIRGGTLKVISKQHPFGSADEGGEVRVYQSGSPTLEFFGATVDKPLVVTSTTLSSDHFSCKDNGYGVCTFAAPFTVQGMEFSMRTQGKTVFAGGGTFTTHVNFMEAGEIVFEGRPFTVSGDKEVRIHNKHAKIVFNVASNSLNFLNFNATWTADGNELHFGVDDAFHNYDTTLALAHKTRVDLHGHSQNFAMLNPFAAGCVITSETPAEFFAFHNYAGLNNATMNVTYAGTFEGQACLSKSGLYTVTLASTNTSTGYLNVQNGPLVLAEGGQWAGTDIRVGNVKTNRKPTLKIRHNDCFKTPRETTITMTTSLASASQIYTSDIIPVIELAEGVNLRVGAVTLDGRPLAGGSWGSSSSAAKHKDDTHFAGTGILRVPGEGSTIIVR